jgi:transcriptional regulator with XRE-family HTH domain
LGLAVGLTQGQLARLAGLSPAVVTNYEHMTGWPGPCAAAALARVLGAGLVGS